MASIAENISTVNQRIAAACAAAGRDVSEVRLMPVSKTHPMAMLREARAAGYGLLAENKVQELITKAAELEPGEDIRFSFIGHLQTNKVRQMAELASEFQAMDSLKIARELDKRLNALGKRMPVLLQVNTSGEPQKFGVAPEEVLDVVAQLEGLDALDVRGLMTVASHGTDEVVSACFRTLQQLQAQLRDAQALGSEWNELSMGMSQDLEQAIAHGSTCVRIGTDIFGARDYGTAA